MAIFHFTVKIVGRSKGKSVISASAYLNGDVMKNEETGRISYYTSKKEVVYTSLMMCENAPPEWLHVPEENIKRFQQSIRYKRADDKDAALEKFKITFQKQRLWNEVLKIEKNADAQLGRSFEFSLPKEWSRQEQIDYTTEYIQKTFVDKGMAGADGIKVVLFNHEQVFFRLLKANGISRDGVGFVAVYTVELDGPAVDINLIVGNMNLTDAHTIRNGLAGCVQHKGI